MPSTIVKCGHCNPSTTFSLATNDIMALCTTPECFLIPWYFKDTWLDLTYSFTLLHLPSCPNLPHCLVIKMLLGCFFSSNSCTQSFNLFLFVSDEEADCGGDLGQAVQKLLSVILRNKVLNPSDCDSDKRSSWVHCGKTKVFLTKLMVSITIQIFSHGKFNLINM